MIIALGDILKVKKSGFVHTDEKGWPRAGELGIVVSQPEWLDHARVVFEMLMSSSGSKVEFTLWLSEVDAYLEKVSGTRW